MKLSSLPEFEVAESAVACKIAIAEATGRVYGFDYANYNQDPRPSVLVLGYWKPPTTGKTLCGGINLHYLNDQQILMLRQALPKILKPRGLKLRYRLGKRLLPGIFDSAYRTYNRDYVSEVQPTQLKDWNPDVEKRKAAKEKQKQELLAKAKEQAKQKEVEKAQQPPPEDPQLKAALDLQRAEQDREREDVYQAKVQELGQDELQRRKMELVKRKVATLLQQPKPDRPTMLPPRAAPPAPEVEPEPDLLSEPVPSQRDSSLELLEPTDEPEEEMRESRDYYYSPRLGFVWSSPAAYIKWHQPAQFRMIERRLPREPVIGVYNTKTGVILVDRVSNHAYIMHQAGWNYEHTVRLSRYGREVVCEHDGSLERFVASARRSFTSVLLK